ncbi:bifunctional methylenetetrahydrofolate dehydrogenase/methenyltetrahydrofolate cyclohydrolase FolD [Candidatus Endomicrobiellum agilis]|uniref:bifunctional methylenetetrahydrofolate dehydrogenase/methenyltetrahydrofolate cyclohydrolase FolD n=1 Tax=Candidatus Endomicrobiellum agilis TaxID=3238957 RepID=UPI00358203E1|nr:bifunctional methylenetetrahydrofolate dehydrogenase/methenyltetrahydrofolate cyclohydrolase FolD [Endomicrobium sp.]MCA6085787.1 bifunctional methylenetetrahydrofolate dehydrogenase/methenyltetrahydrofolate cyclohydrolase FolD [Endomicrobium sp.]
MKLIDGKRISNDKRAEIKEKVGKIKQQTGEIPGLATILVGKDPASQVYIKSKIKACEDVGIKSFHHNLDENSPREEIIALIKKLNGNPEVNGILLQLPLPQNRDAEECINAISPLKDIDGLHPFNAGLLNLSKNWNEIIEKNILVSCTPLGVIHLLHKSNIAIEGKTAVVIGRSNLVGKPLSMLLLANNATVIMAHSRTRNLKEICKSADIIVAAIGKPKFVNKDFIKTGAAVIDVGISRTAEGLCGDIDFNAVKNMDIEITPVPGGVGPMTITMLLENTLKAFNNTEKQLFNK